MTNIFGADIAFTSGTAKVPVLAQTKKFVIIKATQDDFEDPGFHGSMTAAHGSGLIRGSFHFLINSKRVHGHHFDPSISATAQANTYLDAVNSRNSGYTNHLFCLDVENFHRFSTVNGKQVVTYRSIPELQDVDDFVARFQVRLPDAYLLIYTSTSIWGGMGNPKFADRYGSKVRLWYAGGDGSGHPNFDRTMGHLKPTIHQYKIDYLAGHHSLGKTDLDASNLTVGQLKTVANWSVDDIGDPPDDPAPLPDTDLVVINDPEICRDDNDGGRVNPPDSEISAEDGESVAGTGYDASIAYDADQPYDGVTDGLLQFEATVAPANPDDAVQFDWATHDGTAVAGTHYTAASGTATVAAGENHFAQAITMLQPDSARGDKTLSVVLTNPVNATIVDPTAVLTLHYATDPSPRPWLTLDRYIAWPSSNIVYNEFADMRHRNRCTSYAMAAAASALHYRATNNNVLYDPDELFLRAGGSPCPEASPDCLGNGHCCGFLDRTVLLNTKYNRDHPNRGIFRNKHSDGKLRLSAYHQLTAASVDALVIKIKKAVYQQGVVYFSSIFYSNWNSTGSADWAGFILPSHGSAKSNIGHSWVVVGWDDDKGFNIQSSHGKYWAHGGRAWLPYSYIVRRDTANGGSGTDDPWYRFFQVERKTA